MGSKHALKKKPGHKYDTYYRKILGVRERGANDGWGKQRIKPKSVILKLV